jgi:methionine sulfoxide reductase heme-binding subunit
MLQVLNSRYFLWIIMMLPAVPMAAALASGRVDNEGRLATEYLLHPTGEFSARFMILAMMLTPLRMIFPTSKIARWLMVRRRYFGLAAFAYAAFHTVLYVLDMGGLQPMLGEFWSLGIWTGWLAFFIFAPLAITSNDGSVRRMGQFWKTLQRFVYVAAVATLVHWIFVHNNFGGALAHFLPLAILEAFRLWRNMRAARFTNSIHPQQET